MYDESEIQYMKWQTTVINPHKELQGKVSFTWLLGLGDMAKPLHQLPVTEELMLIYHIGMGWFPIWMPNQFGELERPGRVVPFTLKQGISEEIGFLTVTFRFRTVGYLE